MSSSQESRVINKPYVYTGGILACPDDLSSDENCYLDFDKRAGRGIVGKSDATILGTDGKNWAVFYACR